MQIRNIVLVGAGATGTIMGALITKAGLNITLVSNDLEHVSKLNSEGASITGGLSLRVPVKAVLPAQIKGFFDLAIYAVKTTADEVALPQLIPHLHETSLVLTTQNGVPEEQVASYVGLDRTLGGSIVGWAASLDGPGMVRLAGNPKTMLLRIGELDGRISSRLKEVGQIMANVGVVELSTDLAGMRWTKLLINVSMSGLSAALGCTFGQILDNEQALSVALTLQKEVVQTAKALHIEIEQVNGLSPGDFLLELTEDRNSAEERLRNLFHSQRDGKPSMLQDLEKGRLTEVESINGFLSRKAKEAEVKAPVNETVLEIIRGIQTAAYPLSMENLKRISL